MRHLEAFVVFDFVVVAPLVDAHFLADHRHARRRTLANIAAATEQVDRHRCLMAVSHCGDDVFRTKGRVAAEEHFRISRLEGGFIDDRHIPFAELETDVALDPRERILLANGDQHVGAFHEHEVFPGRHQRTFAAGVVDGFDFLEFHADQFAVLHDKFFWHMVIEYRNTFALGVFNFPGRGLHVGARRAHGHRHALAAKADRRAAAIHRGVAATEYDDFFADAGDMAESHTAEPVDTDMDIGL